MKVKTEVGVKMQIEVEVKKKEVGLSLTCEDLIRLTSWKKKLGGGSNKGNDEMMTDDFKTYEQQRTQEGYLTRKVRPS